MNRRQFLKSTAIAAPVAASFANGPIILGAEDKAGSKLARVGTGEHVYECHHNWGELPSGFEWQTTHGTAVDSQGFIYITHQAVGKGTLDTVVVFDPQGKYVRSFGKEWHAGGHGIDIRKDGSEEFVYLCHMINGGPVAKTTLKGEVVWKKGPPAEAKVYEPKKDPNNPTKTVAPRYVPTNVAFLPDGGFFVGDGYGSNYMHRYDASGNWVKTFGGSGTENGKFRTPHGNWIDTRSGKPVLVVCDRANARLQSFTPDGEFLSATEKGTVLFPAHIDIRGDVMLVPDLHARISLLDKNLKPIVHLGEDAEWRKKVLDGFKVRQQPKEWVDGKFVHPHDACFDKDGNIYVAEWVSTGRVSFLKKVG